VLTWALVARNAAASAIAAATPSGACAYMASAAICKDRQAAHSKCAYTSSWGTRRPNQPRRRSPPETELDEGLPRERCGLRRIVHGSRRFLAGHTKCCTDERGNVRIRAHVSTAIFEHSGRGVVVRPLASQHAALLSFVRSRPSTPRCCRSSARVPARRGVVVRPLASQHAAVLSFVRSGDSTGRCRAPEQHRVSTGFLVRAHR